MHRPARAESSGTPTGGGKGSDYGDGSATGGSPSGSVEGGLIVGTGTSGAGTVLTGPDGMTLYIFTKDTEDTSACAGDCAKAWPPLIAAEGGTISAADGVPGALSTFARDDGTRQVSYNGQPLYAFAADKVPGDTTGQGVNDVWFIAQP